MGSTNTLLREFQDKGWKTKFPRQSWLYLFCILIVYGVLLLPTVSRQGISWDEQMDLWVARAYLKSPDGWRVGSDIDPSQTRLPAFTVALVYALLNKSGLILARYISCMVGALTLVAVFFYGKRRYDTRRGILACALLATSPFFLSFARVAFTETDIYLACTLAWLLVCVDRLQDQPSIRWAAVVGVMAGLCLSAKFTALAVLPPVWYAVWQSKQRHPQNTTSWFKLVLFITGLAMLTFLVVPPEHLTNPSILRSLAGRFQHEMTYRPGFMVEAAALHIFSIFFKSSLVIGAGMLLSLILATFQWRNWKIRFPILVVWFYFGCLVALPLAQTFYTIPLLPFLAVFTADQFLALVSRQRATVHNTAKRAVRNTAAAVGLAGLAVLMLGVDLVLCYPDYNLNGYQWLGKSMLAGRPSVGYRSVVQTPSDGVEQVMEWLNVHAKPGERVRTYLLPWHIVQAVAPDPVYKLENGLQGQVLADPDYVVVEINAQVRQSWWIRSSPEEVFRPPYDSAWLESNYTKVFSVRRAFGIEMASVFRKK